MLNVSALILAVMAVVLALYLLLREHERNFTCTAGKVVLVPAHYMSEKGRIKFYVELDECAQLKEVTK